MGQMASCVINKYEINARMLLQNYYIYFADVSIWMLYNLTTKSNNIQFPMCTVQWHFKKAFLFNLKHDKNYENLKKRFKVMTVLQNISKRNSETVIS